MQLDNLLNQNVNGIGYNQTSIPAGDLARIEEALNNVQDSFWVSKIIEQVEDVMKQKRTIDGILNNNITPAGRRENIAGDVDRTISTTDYTDTLKHGLVYTYMRRIV